MSRSGRRLSLTLRGGCTLAVAAGLCTPVLGLRALEVELPAPALARSCAENPAAGAPEPPAPPPGGQDPGTGADGGATSSPGTGTAGADPATGPAARPRCPPAAPAVREPGPLSVDAVVEEGLASYYGARFQGRRTASGQPFDPRLPTAAHPRLPLGTRVRITNLDNGRSTTAVVNDRGPYSAGRIVDVSLAVAHRLRFVRAGVARVRLEALSGGASPPKGPAATRSGPRPAPGRPGP